MILRTSKFIVTQDFSRLREINYDARMEEALKKLGSKN